MLAAAAAFAACAEHVVMYRTACEGGVVVAAAVVADDTCGCGNRVEVLVPRRRRRTRAAWEACYEEGAVARSLLSSSGRRRYCGRFAVAARFVMCLDVNLLRLMC